MPEAESKSAIDSDQYPASLGVTWELCAGIVDKDLSLIEITREEIREECGYDVPAESISKITSFRSLLLTFDHLQN